MNEWEKLVRAHFEQAGYRMLRGGWPDFLAVRGAERFGVEVKRQHDDLRPAQIEMRAVLVDLGLAVKVVRPEDLASIAREVSGQRGRSSSAIGKRVEDFLA